MFLSITSTPLAATYGDQYSLKNLFAFQNIGKNSFDLDKKLSKFIMLMKRFDNLRFRENMVTLEDVAKLAGVSLSTASVALNNRGRVASETREKVLRAAKKLGYIPNGLARNLVSGKTGVIGILLAEIMNPYHASLVHHLKEEIQRNGYRMSLVITDGDGERERKAVEDLISQRVEGVVVHSADIVNFDLSLFYELVRRKIPTVLVGERIEGIPIPTAEIDLGRGMFELTRYLIARGYRRFLLLSGSKSVITFRRRIDAFRRAIMASTDSILKSDVIEVFPSFEGAYRAILEIMGNDRNSYDVVMCVNDYMALGVLRAFQELGVKVPDEIGVTGFDDLPFAQVASVPLTTVHIPVGELVTKSIDMLCKVLLGKEPYSMDDFYATVDTKVVIRQSTR